MVGCFFLTLSEHLATYGVSVNSRSVSHSSLRSTEKWWQRETLRFPFPLYRTRSRSCTPVAVVHHAVSLPVPLRVSKICYIFHYHCSPLLIINSYHIPSKLLPCFTSFIITTRTTTCKYTLRQFSCQCT